MTLRERIAALEAERAALQLALHKNSCALQDLRKQVAAEPTPRPVTSTAEQRRAAWLALSREA